jgi:hypothetical protein
VLDRDRVGDGDPLRRLTGVRRRFREDLAHEESPDGAAGEMEENRENYRNDQDAAAGPVHGLGEEMHERPKNSP